MGLTSSLPPQFEETLEELYERAPCGYLSALDDGRIVRVNQTFLDWTGYQRDLVLGKRLRDFLPAPGRVFYETHFDPLLRMQGFVREMALDLVCATGGLLPILVNSVQHRHSSGRPVITRSTIFDATERRTYERELLEARRRAEQLALVVESSADAIILSSADGTVQTWSPGAERLFGYSAAEAKGETIAELIVPQDRIGEFENIMELVRSGQQVQLETVRLRKDRSRLDVSLGLTPHIEPPHELTAISAIIRDITERRRIEARLHQAEQLRSVATLAGGVAHEVNNQMAVVLGYGDFVLSGLGSGHPSAADVHAMVAAASKAAGISRQLLAFSRQLPIVGQEVQLAALVAGAKPSLTELLGSEISLVLEGRSSGWVSADPDQVQQILVQVVSNARDSMPSGGTVIISIEDVCLAEADVAAYPGDNVVPGTYVLLTVRDTGVGMDGPTLTHAFEPFFTTKPFGQGTGLGLAVVHGIVKQHGGHIWATSEPGQGTAINIYLPALPR